MAFFVRSAALRAALVPQLVPPSRTSRRAVRALPKNITFGYLFIRLGEPGYFPTKKLYHSIDRRINLACNPTSLSWM